MKKILRHVAAIMLLGGMCFLGGVWPEDTPRKKVVRYDSGAFAIVLVCGLYLKRTEGKNERD